MFGEFFEFLSPVINSRCIKLGNHMMDYLSDVIADFEEEYEGLYGNRVKVSFVDNIYCMVVKLEGLAYVIEIDYNTNYVYFSNYKSD